MDEFITNSTLLDIIGRMTFSLSSPCFNTKAKATMFSATNLIMQQTEPCPQTEVDFICSNNYEVIINSTNHPVILKKQTFVTNSTCNSEEGSCYACVTGAKCRTIYQNNRMFVTLEYDQRYGSAITPKYKYLVQKLGSFCKCSV